MGRPALFLPLSAHTASRAHTACRLPTMEYPNAGHRAAYTKLHAPRKHVAAAHSRAGTSGKEAHQHTTSIHAQEPPLRAALRQQQGRQHCPTQRISAPANLGVRAADPAECVSSTSAWSWASCGCATTSHSQLLAAMGNAAGCRTYRAHIIKSSASPVTTLSSREKRCFTVLMIWRTEAPRGPSHAPILSVSGNSLLRPSRPHRAADKPDKKPV